jgi:hypothetical protein
MCATAQLDFFRIVLDPGVNIKIFLDGGIKYNIYKFHTMGPAPSLLPLSRIDTF